MTNTAHDDPAPLDTEALLEHAARSSADRAFADLCAAALDARAQETARPGTWPARRAMRDDLSPFQPRKPAPQSIAPAKEEKP